MAKKPVTTDGSEIGAAAEPKCDPCPCIEACKKIAEMKKCLCDGGMGETAATSMAFEVWKHHQK